MNSFQAVRLPFFLLGFMLCTNLKAQVQVSIFAGPQATSARYLVRDAVQPAEHKIGGMGGVALKVPFDVNLYFFPAVYYTMKGYRVTLNDRAFPPTQLAVNNSTTIHAVELAPLLQYDFSRKNGHFFIRMGPSIDIVHSGTETFDTSLNGNAPSVSRDMVFSFADYGRITAAANVHFGYEVNRSIMVFMHYGYGIGSLNNADNGPRILHRIAGISLGWLIGKNPLVMNTRVKR